MITLNPQYQYHNNLFTGKINTSIPNIHINKSEKNVYNNNGGRLSMNIDGANKFEIGNYLQRKSKSLPETIDSMFYNMGLYLKGEVSTPKFIEFYNKSTEPLYRRIAEGKEKELFKESYAPELKVITTVRNKINNIDSNNLSTNDELSDTIETLSKEYLKTPIDRKKIFPA